MPHQCVRCNILYEDGSKELLSGCPKCGGKFFFYIKKEHLNEVKDLATNLDGKQKEQIEKDVLDILGEKANDKPVILDIESIRVLKPGQYILDIVKLFRKYPVIYRLEEGKYVIDLMSTFKKILNNTKKQS